MLFTRCPDCETTFRITADALRKANGQVRCGRCACVFNAYSELREHYAEPQAQAEEPQAHSEEPQAQSEEPPLQGAIPSAAANAGDGDAGASKGERPAAEVVSPPVERARRETRTEADSSFGDLTVADVLEQIESGAVDESADKHAVGDSGVEAFIEGETDESKPAQWRLVDAEAAGSRRGRVWTSGCAAAALILGLQFLHHFRADVAGAALVGPLIRDAYAVFGTEVVPNWNVSQYEIVDWVATAEPKADGQGSLIITARIRNKGPEALPYPHVHVQLKDRWEDSVGSRIFEPAEYLTVAGRTSRPMPAGTTASAKLEVVDPGPDAYGFELDVCVEGEAETLRCSLDQVFPSM